MPQQRRKYSLTDPDASSATAYMWFVWERDTWHGYNRTGPSELVWIPPGAKRRHTATDDRARFAGEKP